MSADNWTVCPRCRAADPFMDQTDEKGHTLREDYEIGVCAGGCFEVTYRARCEACQWHFEFKHANKVFRAERAVAR